MSRSRGFIDIAAVKAAVTLEQILQHYGLLEKLRPSGASLRGCCPIHKGTDSKQFSVTLEKNAWKCFSECSHGGNHIDFVMRMEDCSLSEAGWKLNEWFDLGLEKDAETRPRKPASPRADSLPRAGAPRTAPREPEERASSTATAPKSAPAPDETGENEPNEGFNIPNLDTAHPYLAERGLSADTIAHFGIGYCAKGIMAGRIAIPIHNAEGQIVANAGRWPGEPPEGKEKYRLPGKFKKTLEVFNFHRAAIEPDASPLVIVEGFFGVMHLWQHGIRRVVALMGWHLSERQQELIARLVTPDSRIVLMLDQDEAGTTATEKAAARLTAHCFVRAYRWPEGITQPDQLAPGHLAQLAG